MRIWIIALAVIIGLCLVGTAYAVLKPNPNAGDRSKLVVTFDPDEQHRLDAVTVTQSDLEAATGKDGARCYVAVNGVVYDMSVFPTWTRGLHHGVHAGTDATEAFVKTGHARAVLERMPVVGRLGA